MATTSATLSFTSAAMVENKRSSSQRRMPKVVQITGLNSFGGLKAQNSVASLGLPVSTEQSFAKFATSLKGISQRKGRGGGGALSSTCNAAAEIFQIVVVISGLTLAGVAAGFVLLRMEAFVEESE